MDFVTLPLLVLQAVAKDVSDRFGLRTAALLSTAAVGVYAVAPPE